MTKIGANVLWTTTRALRATLRGIPVSHPVEELKSRDQRLITAWWLARAFYLFLFFDSFAMIEKAHRWVVADRIPDPVWLVSWTNLVGISEAIRFLSAGYVLTAFLAVIFTRYRWARLAVALFAVNIFAIENSFGYFHHYHYYPLWISIVFIGLPNGTLESLRTSRVGRECYLGVFFLSQFVIAMFYSLSGLYKCVRGLWPSADGISSFAPEALPRLVIARWFEGGESVFLEGLFAGNQWLAWPTFLLVIFIETAAVIAVFRPQLHVLMGVTLAVFHIVIWMVMGIRFDYQPVIVCMLFVLSPFKPTHMPSMREVFLQIPVFGDLARVVKFHRLRVARPAVA